MCGHLVFALVISVSKQVFLSINLVHNFKCEDRLKQLIYKWLKIMYKQNIIIISGNLCLDILLLSFCFTYFENGVFRTHSQTQNCCKGSPRSVFIMFFLKVSRGLSYRPPRLLFSILRGVMFWKTKKAYITVFSFFGSKAISKSINFARCWTLGLVLRIIMNEFQNNFCTTCVSWL